MGYARKKDKRSKKGVELRIDNVRVVDTVVVYIEKKTFGESVMSFADAVKRPVNDVDSLINDFFDQGKMDALETYTKIAFAKDSLTYDTKVTSIKDEELINRFNNMHTLIELPYHPIMKKFISRYIDNPKFMDNLLGRSLIYMPIFEEELLKQEMPLEIKMLPIVESALIPSAVSYMGAGGLWQFMPATAKIYGLKISSLVDERMDVLKSTRAACI